MILGLQAGFLAELPPAAEPELFRRQRAAAIDLLVRWREPHRRYHTQTHVVAVLDALDELLAGPEPVHVPDPCAVRLAAWFHDAVYQGRPGHDEEASAVLAEQVLAGLGPAPEQIAEVARLVRMTARHSPEPGDVAAEVLADADLAVLGGPDQTYRDYAAAVRQEYVQVPDDAFRRGRSEVLRRLTAGPWIYRTPRGRALWEVAARTNVAAELTRLGYVQ